MRPQPIMKRCPKCGEIKLADQFYMRHNPLRKDTLLSRCKPCVSADRKAAYAASAHITRHSPTPKVPRSCWHCGKDMLVYQSEIRRGNGKYCSPACHRAEWWGHRIEDFWSKVEKQEGDGCWLWTGLRQKGYGSFSMHNKDIPAHRFSWELANGEIQDGLYVCHQCDDRYPLGDITSRLCVRPDHLFLGTQRDNMRDAAAKGRLGKRRARSS